MSETQGPCTTAICPLCQGVSWTGEPVEGDDIKDVMEKYPQKDWCTCEHVLDSKHAAAPPKAGTGEKKSN